MGFKNKGINRNKHVPEPVYHKRSSAKPPQGPTLAERKEAAAKAKAERKAAIATKVAARIKKLTEISTVTAQQAGALVAEYDDAVKKVEDLKPHLGNAKAELASTKEDIRSTARCLRNAKRDRMTEGETSKLGQDLAGFEKAAEELEVRIAGLQEQRDGHKETAKAAMAELRKLIRDKIAGGLLFEKPAEETPAKGKASSNSSGSAATGSLNGSATMSTDAPAKSKAPATTPPPTPTDGTADTALLKADLTRAELATLEQCGVADAGAIRSRYKGYTSKGVTAANWLCALPGVTVGLQHKVETILSLAHAAAG